MITRDRTFGSWMGESLVWLPELGMGHYPVRAADEPYRNGGARAYWDRYVGYAQTPMGRALTDARVELVRGWTMGPVLDVGIGAGAFIEAYGAQGGLARGYDVNPHAMAWLLERGLWLDPHPPSVTIAALTLFDVLEHLPDPGQILGRVSDFVFVSLPVFRDVTHVLESKHFRPTEHRWYWTVDGLIRWMKVQGFECIEHDDRETQLGREDIGTFVFRRLP